MHIQKSKLLRGTLGVALAMFATATGCDVESEFEEDIIADLDLDEDIDFRSSGDYYDPVGQHEVATCSTIAGYAKDGDSTDSTQVHIYKGAPFPHGQHVMNVWADGYRADLPGPQKNIGFHIATPAAFKTGCPERVYVHALDLDVNGNFVPGGNNRLISNTGKQVSCGPPPPQGCDFNPGGDDGPFNP